VEQRLGQSRDQPAHMRRVFRFEMQVVDEDQQHTACRIAHQPAGRRWQDNAFRCRHRRGLDGVERPATVHERKRVDGLRHTVLEHREVGLRQIRNEPSRLVARNDVGRDMSHGRPEGRRLWRRILRL
jgi:hypothetical protein